MASKVSKAGKRNPNPQASRIYEKEPQVAVTKMKLFTLQHSHQCDGDGDGDDDDDDDKSLAMTVAMIYRDNSKQTAGKKQWCVLL